MPVNARDFYWVKAHKVKAHKRYYPAGHRKREEKKEEAKIRARHKRAAKLKTKRAKK